MTETAHWHRTTDLPCPYCKATFHSFEMLGIHVSDCQNEVANRAEWQERVRSKKTRRRTK